MTDIVLRDDAPKPTAEALTRRYCQAHSIERPGILHALAELSWQPGYMRDGAQMPGVEFILHLGSENPYKDTSKPLGYENDRVAVREAIIGRKFAAHCLKPGLSGQLEHDILMATGLIRFYGDHPGHRPKRSGDQRIVKEFLSRCIAAISNQRMAYLLGDEQDIAKACLYTHNISLVREPIRHTKDFFQLACRYASDYIDPAYSKRYNIDLETPHCSVENVLKLVYQLKFTRGVHFPELAELLTELAVTFVHSPEKVSFRHTLQLAEKDSLPKLANPKETEE